MENILLDSLYKYYSDKQTMNKLLTILESNQKISLRIIDWFVTNYSKKNNVFYHIRLVPLYKLLIYSLHLP